MGYFNTTTTSSQTQTGNQVATTYHKVGREWNPGWDKGPVLWRWVDTTWTEYSWVPYTFTPTKTAQELKIIGIKNAYLQPSSTPYGMTLKKFDTSSYVDRAVLQLKNETAGNVVVRDISIRGEPVYQIAGQNGFVWEYSDYDSIDKNGEQFREIGNDFIFDAGQCESIGDFAWKLLKPHQTYQLALRGCQYQYQIGDVYTLSLDYSLDASSSQIELVDIDVEIIGVSFERSVGSVGSTILACRVDLGAWSKTTSRRAQLVGTGQANNNTNRTNTVTVASSTYTGTADYYCDGTDDHVEIQRAIDDLYAIGGGTLQFTNGTYNITNGILVNSNVSLNGMGESTILNNYSNGFISLVYNGAEIKNISTNCNINGLDNTTIIENCNIYGSSIINAPQKTIISSCKLKDSSRIIAGNGTLISKNVFSTASSTNIFINNDQDVVINGNIFNFQGNTLRCIYISSSVRCVASNNRIIGITVTSTSAIYGIRIELSSNNIISNNNISSIINNGTGSAFGISIGANSDRNNINGNTSLSCTTNYFNGGTNTTATGNIFA